MRKHGRVDTNHAEIVQALRDIGASVVSLASIGDGCGDVLVGLRGENFLLEIKTMAGKLTRDEMCFMTEWKGHYMIVRTVEQAIDAVTNPAARRIELPF